MGRVRTAYHDREDMRDIAADCLVQFNEKIVILGQMSARSNDLSS